LQKRIIKYMSEESAPYELTEQNSEGNGLSRLDRIKAPLYEALRRSTGESLEEEAIMIKASQAAIEGGKMVYERISEKNSRNRMQPPVRMRQPDQQLKKDDFTLA
jgi:hypothetical protein